LRELIVAAAATVYASHGFSASSVERIISAAKVSSPTFYKHFKDRREILDIIIARADDSLREIATDMTVDAENLEGFVEATIDAYFEWGAPQLPAGFTDSIRLHFRRRLS
jgi:AcrR family transcriptional regulator